MTVGPTLKARHALVNLLTDGHCHPDGGCWPVLTACYLELFMLCKEDDRIHCSDYEHR